MDIKRKFAIYNEKEMKPEIFLYELSKANICGLLTDNEAEKILKRYFINHMKEMNYKNSLVELRINKVLAYPNFELSQEYLYAINAYLFKDIFLSCGQLRDCNLYKKEEILNGESVIYSDFHKTKEYLEYDFSTFKKNKTNNREFINNLCDFIIHIWQAHPFSDGNTRTIIIFLEKYLASIGIKVDNNFFKQNSSYIRNALVMGCFATNLKNKPDNSYFLNILNKIINDNNIELLPIENKVKVLKKD